MAKRENQGTQIALILLVMLSILLMITSYFFWSHAHAKTAEATELRSAIESANENRDGALTQNQQLKQMIGYPADQLLPAIETDFTADMQLIGQAFPEGDRNYRNLSKHMITVVQQKNANLVEASAKELELKQDLDRAQEEGKQRVAVAEQERDARTTELEEERAKFNTSRQRLQAELEKNNRSSQAKLSNLTRQNHEFQNQVGTLEQEVGNLNRLTKRLKQENEELLDETFEQPDGKIVHVNQALRLAYINLGRNHALRPKVSFRVYDADSIGLADVERKGSIEITRITDGDQAEARILDDDSVTNPIMAGDVIYSPIWQAGRRTTFALAGFMDIDGDGRSDREMVKNIISLNGGVVQAEITDKGKRTGDVTIHTRYLVLGEMPTENSGARGLAANSQITEIRNEAQQLGVALIDLDRLLDDMGYHGSARSVSLGRDARASDMNDREVPDPRPLERRFLPRREVTAPAF